MSSPVLLNTNALIWAMQIPLTGENGILAEELEGLPGNPADRIITATALLRGHTMLTSDRRILDWQGQLAKHNARD